MKLKKSITGAIIILCLSLIIGTTAFIYDSNNAYAVDKDFLNIPLNFNPDDSSSTYLFHDANVTVYGGFIKGIKKGKHDQESLIIRALSPLPRISVEGGSSETLQILLENINPDFYAKSLPESTVPITMTKVLVNTLQLDFAPSLNETINISPASQSGPLNYVVLGDNRDGYDTFEAMIEQLNGQSQLPLMVIDNGDLVFSGKPNQYRLFDQMTSKLSTTFLTTLGNHDIRGQGRDTYTMLYGPPYYSFDYADFHFVFLDSSPGWSEKKAISDEQYLWLEQDLIKATGKRIFVINHIPPTDPRSGTKTNEIPELINKVKNGNNLVEQKLNDYNASKDMNHGFQDSQEAAKFEQLMTSYHVDTVYLSHIHSYMDYTKDGVRYMITGGAGAELLTKNSYYHYIIAPLDTSNVNTIIQSPSPANNYIMRYVATIELFATAMAKENPISILFFKISFGLLLILLILRIYLIRKQSIEKLIILARDIGKYGYLRFKELFKNNDPS